jgi:hypothetical protein
MKAAQIAEELSISYSCVRRYMNGEAKATPKKSGPKGLVRANGGKLPNGMSGLLRKWNEEADAVFIALPLEKKAEILARLE